MHYGFVGLGNLGGHLAASLIATGPASRIYGKPGNWLKNDKALIGAGRPCRIRALLR